jgi:uncharacterized protein (DUF362 family)
MTRRELLAMAAVTPLLKAAPEPVAATVAIAPLATYDIDPIGPMNTMFDQLGGLGRIVRNKTVTIKLNLTGSPGLRFQGLPLGLTHYTHPRLVAATAYLMGQAGATRIRFVESAWASGGPLEEYLLDSGWNVRSLIKMAPHVEFVNTNNMGRNNKSYARFKVPGRPYMFPAYDLNRAYEDTDVFVSLAKLKNHATCGVTLAMKNCFGMTPASIYGDDAGIQEPNESPTSGRVTAMHEGKRGPSLSSPQELYPKSSRDPGYRMPRIVADLAKARPIDLSIIDGVQSVAGGEGPWVKGLRVVKPGVIIAGLNPVNTDAVATAVMGYDPRAPKGAKPFAGCDNTLLLAEANGAGSADLRKIEVAGVPIAKAVFVYG